jgi:hypothetical protein
MVRVSGRSNTGPEPRTLPRLVPIPYRFSCGRQTSIHGHRYTHYGALASPRLVDGRGILYMHSCSYLTRSVEGSVYNSDFQHAVVKTQASLTANSCNTAENKGTDQGQPRKTLRDRQAVLFLNLKLVFQTATMVPHWRCGTRVYIWKYG